MTQGRNILFVGGPAHGKLIYTETVDRDWLVPEPTLELSSSPTGSTGGPTHLFHRYVKQYLSFGSQIVEVFMSSGLSPDMPEGADTVVNAMIKALELEYK